MSDQITVVGTIANVPERRTTANGVAVANFRLATNVRRRDETSGAWIDGHTNWYTVSAYRGLADHALASLQKGQRVIVSGSFKLREWESNGRQGMSAEIDAHSLGHDLLWGTTRFERDEHARRENGGSAHAGRQEPTDVRPETDSRTSPGDAAWDGGGAVEPLPF